MIRYEEGYAIFARDELNNLLNSIDNQFVPPLSTFTDLAEYIEKLNRKAYFIKSLDQTKVAGICAYYDNDPFKDKAFLSLIFVESEYHGRGIGSELMNRMITNLQMQKFKNVDLEVNKQNSVAINLYSALGFATVSCHESTLVMRKKL